MARGMGWVRPQDAVLLVLFAAVASVSPTRDASEVALLAVLAGLQIAGPRIPAFGTRYGRLRTCWWGTRWA